VSIGSHEVTAMFVIDSTERTFGAQKHNSTDRLLMGEQYHDISSNLTLPDINIGSAVTDLNIPSNDFGKPGVGRELITDHPLADGLVGAWLLNEGSGTAGDSAGSNDGTLSGATWTAEGVDFPDGSTTDKISCGADDSLNFSGNLTLFSVVNMSATAHFGTVAARSDAGILFTEGDYGYALLLRDISTNLYMYVNIADGTNYDQTGTQITDIRDGDYHSVAMVRDGDDINGYVDSINEVIRDGSGIGDISVVGQPFQIGNDDDNDHAFKGDIKVVYAFNRALSPQEIASLHADPYQMFRHGMASDGAYHIDSSSSATELEFNQDEINPVAVIHEASVQAGDNTEHLIGHWKCDDNADDTVVVDDTGNFTSVSSTNTDTYDSADSVRGGSLYLNPSSGGSSNGDYIDLGVYDISNWMDSFTISLEVKAEGAFDASNSNTIFDLFYSNTDRLSCSYDGYENAFTLLNDLTDASVVTVISEVYSSDEELHEWRKITISVDLQNDKIICKVDNTLTVINVTESWGAIPVGFYIGQNNTTIRNFKGKIDSIKLYDSCILPYGSFIPSNVTHYSNVHSDISLYVKGDETVSPTLGTEDLVLTDIMYTADVMGNRLGAFRIDLSTSVLEIGSNDIDYSVGCIGLWIKTPSSSTSNACIVEHSTDYTAFSVYKNTPTSLRYRYGGVSTDLTVTDFWDDRWHYISIHFDSVNNQRWVVIDGIKSAVNTTAITAPSSASLLVGTGNSSQEMIGSICNITITNNPHTPQIPFVLGHGPIYVPDITKDGRVLRPGTDYQTVSSI